AIVVYLNQYPHQPRERDYAYAGSFYAFAIWIGLGVLALYEALKKVLPDTVNAGAVTVVSLLLVPTLMGAQNWDDHDRSDRYSARDLGANYLKTCAEQGIIFTNGDNDTFPLWYNQEVEGVRTDVRVCNLSYLQTDWYISQMKRQAYESKPLPFSLTEEQYTQGTRDVVYLLDDPRLKRTSIDLQEAVKFVANDDKSSKLAQADYAAYLPKKVLTLKVDKEAVIRNKVVRPEDYDKIVDTMYIDLSNKDYLPKDEFMILDLIANNNWERPIYFAITVTSQKYLNLQDYFQLEGFAYRLVPIKNPEAADRISFGRAATDIMYDNLMNKFKWGNLNDPKVYIDENNARMMSNIRNNFNRLAAALVEEGKADSALTVIDKCMELVPSEVVPYDYFALDVINTLYMAGAKEKAAQMTRSAFGMFNDELSYFFSLSPRQMNSQDVGEEMQRNLFFLQKMERTCRIHGDNALADEIGKAMQDHFGRFQKF
ncbi:MAG TPA: hypothetical protein PK167_02945, partial [Prolixibacteraceae bacterium]|nr:hypothetical protein [Prolixibacteraceae bacterium]